MQIVNLTPHTINILRAGPAGPEPVIAIEPSEKVARLEVTRQEVANLICVNGEDVIDDPHDLFGGVSLQESRFGEPVLIENGEEIPFPDESPDKFYIVSSLFRGGFDRPDLWNPGELVRDADGKPIGCLGLSR